MDQQGSEIGVAAFADAEEPGFTPNAVELSPRPV
jgi:hypothetical protein